MKKTVSFLLCLLMVLTSVPVFAGSLNNTGYVQDSNGIKYNVFVPEISMSGSIYDVYPYKNSDNSGLSLAGYTKGASKEINLGYFDIAKWIVSLSDDAEPDYNSGQPYLKSDERLKAVASLLSAINK